MDNISPLESIVYQIYPRSFMDANGDGIGDLKGIIEKLPYLEDLGINAIWLSPIFLSPMVDFGYDVSDYIKVDPIFGTDEDLEQLIIESKKRSIKIILDFVPNHTSSEHPWFKESQSSRTNPKRDWYVWADPKHDGSPPNNWLSYFGGSAWTLDETSSQYYYHAFDKNQPDLNWRNPEVVATMKEILIYWMNKGIDGFRVDAVSYLFEDQELRDELPNSSYDPLIHTTYRSLNHNKTTFLPETLEVIKEFSEVMKKYNTSFLITEFPSGASLTQLMEIYKKVKWKNFSPFNFSFITLPWNAENHKKFIDNYYEALSTNFLPNFVLGNHDRSRVASRIGVEQAKVATVAQLTLRGIPFIYYGDEIGMTDTPVPKEKIVDTYALQSRGSKVGRDPERTPMQWNDSKNAGFSNSSNPWLPINENYLQVNQEKELSDPQSFLNLYKNLISLRKKYRSLTLGEYISLPNPAENVLSFLREFKTERTLTLLNFDSKDKEISLPYDSRLILCSTHPDPSEDISLKNFVLRGDEGIVLLLS